MIQLVVSVILNDDVLINKFLSWHWRFTFIGTLNGNLDLFDSDTAILLSNSDGALVSNGKVGEYSSSGGLNIQDALSKFFLTKELYDLF